MGHIGNVYADFPKPIFQRADGKGIVKVFGIFRVDGESGYFPEIFAAGYFFGGNFRRNLIRGFLYRLRIDVWQSEFGQDGVHLGSVISGFAENIEHLPDRVFGFIRPFCYFYHCFVTGLSALQLIFGDEDVVGKRAVLRYEEGIRFLYFQCADKGIVGTLQYFNHFPFGFAPAAFGIKGDAHFIIIHRMGGVTLCYEYRISASFGDEGVLSIAFALEGSGHLYAVIVKLIFVFIYFGYVVISQEIGQDIHAKHF